VSGAGESDGRPAFLVTLEAAPSDVPAEARLRRLPKLALRGFDMKCLHAEPVTLPDPATPAQVGAGRGAGPARGAAAGALGSGRGAGGRSAKGAG
jgi:hypothetical protein